MLASFPKVPKTQRPKALKIEVFAYATVVFAPSPGNPREYWHKAYIARVMGYIVVAYSMCPSSLKFSWWAPREHVHVF